MQFEPLPFITPGFRDIVEILIVAFLIYRLLLFLAGTKALQIILGLLFLVLVYFAAVIFKLDMITTMARSPRWLFFSRSYGRRWREWAVHVQFGFLPIRMTER